MRFFLLYISQSHMPTFDSHYLIAASCMWVTLGSDAILAVRTYAFLLRDRRVIIGLGTLLLGECAYLFYVSIKGVYQVPILIGTEGPCEASDFPGKHVGTHVSPDVVRLRSLDANC